MIRRTWIVVFASLLLYGCSSKENRRIVERFPTGQVKKEVVYPYPEDTNLHTLITYFPSGQVNTKLDYNGERFDGRIEEYYENGQKKFECATVMGKFTGVKRLYDEQGRLTEIDSLFEDCDVNNCCCDGMVTRFYSTGGVKERFTKRSGKMNGAVTTYYENGVMESRRTYVDDHEEGVTERWFNNGELKMHRTYHLGRADGPTTEYYATYRIEGQYVMGKEVGDWRYIDTAGKTIRVDRYINGVLQ